MRTILAAAALAFLSACGGPQGTDQGSVDAVERPLDTGLDAANDTSADVEEVVAANDGSAIALEPKPIGYPDMERHDIYGFGCSFVPEGGGIGAIAVLLLDAGYMKVDGEVLRFAPDPGSSENAAGVRMVYDSASHSLKLTLAEETDAEGKAPEAQGYDARLTVRDAKSREVYRANGYAQCGA
jgi:hypothetical protein